MRKQLQKEFVEALRIAVDECGIENNKSGTATFHSIRGTAITWFKEHGVKGEELRSITGHKSSSVEDICARDIATISRIAHEFDGM